MLTVQLLILEQNLVVWSQGSLENLCNECVASRGLILVHVNRSFQKSADNDDRRVG